MQQHAKQKQGAPIIITIPKVQQSLQRCKCLLIVTRKAEQSRKQYKKCNKSPH